ncbi:acetyl-CoA/propionyl-CoA carboxylase biotin carboxyl carrier protein [Arthrobacter stackebrandtii]|uniref:biotin carboxylase n=1 Tax=Arthrobacter stackebrandtii TaxID=272161 RepID=A0ABS4YRA8_9MICC|nr:biotin carboxylase N-terminal domain-containing protein [Arthrobacter stackebrandtii]MBP2411331.1 acetyl-CoA/propionyl-CoA carboxylase biotin carboxyl carrier protein [Arthrobacter stackebrandtii]PYH00155.1 acetyl/propionyl-CoA carboxylase subunit alpha [Arthrobacter stackebrandtii]
MTELPDTRLFDTVLVANRGEIACRVIRTLRARGIRSVAVYSEADAGARHVREADQALCIGPAAAAESYLNIAAVIGAARASDAQAVHPGYGFLSENLEFAKALEAAGITFIGPNIEALNVMGDKIRSKNHVAAAGVPVVPGISEPGLTDADLIAAAADIGYPLLIKPSAGGGGKGMHSVFAAEELPATLATARRVAAASFGDDTLFLERLVANPRHIEVQILGDTFGNVIHLGERECSLQRRHQKVIEEAPSPLLSGLDDGGAVRARIGAAACAAAASVNYTGAGTVEFLVSDDTPDEFFFMEMNTRLQVEHPVTEMVARVRGKSLDLVEWQLRIAAGEKIDFTQQDVTLEGHAVEARVYAESPAEGFLPATGTVVVLEESVAQRPGVRVDSSLARRLKITANYDPMLAKVIAWGTDRREALDRLDAALADYVVLGVPTNVEYLRLLVADPDVQAGRLDTNMIERKLPDMAFRTVDAGDYAAAALAARKVDVARPNAPGEAPAASSWGRLDGWRLGDPAPWRSAWAAPGRTGVVTVSGPQADSGTEGPGVVHVNGIGGDQESRTALDLNGTTGGELLWDGQERGYRVGMLGETVFLGSGGWSVALERLDREAATARMLAGLEREDAAADPQLRSPMPGTVTVVNAKTGDRVAAGDVLLAVEAMKMEHQITATMAGTVHIGVAVGALVKADQVVATVEPDEDNSTTIPEGE